MSRARWREAIKLLERAEELAREHFDLSWTLGWAHFKLAHHRQAIHWLRRASRIAPARSAGHGALGVALKAAGRVAAAEVSLLRAIALRDSDLARLSLGVLYLDAGRHAQAEKIHRESVRLEPKHRERFESLAAMLDDLGQIKEAREIRRQAKALPTRIARRRAERSAKATLRAPRLARLRH